MPSKKSKTKHLGNTKLNLNLYQQNDKRVLCANGAQHDDVRSANGKKHMAQEDSHRHVEDFCIYILVTFQVLLKDFFMQFEV